jgi:hypothetical protein
MGLLFPEIMRENIKGQGWAFLPKPPPPFGRQLISKWAASGGDFYTSNRPIELVLFLNYINLRIPSVEKKNHVNRSYGREENGA